MFLIGLTGGIASGKSTVSAIFAKEYNIPVIDADLISRKVVEPNRTGWRRVRKVFGDQILNEDKTINREKLGEIIFNDSNKRRQLNKCLHGLIIFEILKEILLYLLKGYRYIILDIPLLFEVKFALKLISYKVVVYCDEKEQIKRLLKRNVDLTENDAKLRIQSQINNIERLKLCDYSIDNSEDINYTRRQISNLFKIFEESKIYLYVRFGLLVFSGLLFTGFYKLFRLFF